VEFCLSLSASVPSYPSKALGTVSKGNSRFNVRFLGLSVAVLGAGLVALQLSRAQACATRLPELALARSIRLEGGKVERGFFAAAQREARISFTEQGLHGVVSRVAVDAPSFDTESVTLTGVQLQAGGEPGPLVDGLLALLKGDLRGWRLLEVSLDYEHPALGRARFRGIQVASSDGPASSLRVARVELGGASWSDVLLSVERRPQGLDVGLGAAKPAEAKLRLTQFATPRGTSEWIWSAAYQPLPELLTRLGWTTPPSLEQTAGVGSITLVHSHSANPPLAGDIRYTADRWPKPDWPEAEELLGRTAAFYAKLAPTAQPFELDAPFVGITTPLFSLKGSGKLNLLGPRAHIAFDASGTQDCRRLAVHTPPSRYRDAVTAFSAAPVDPGGPEPRLRLTLDARGSGEPAASFQVSLSAGCGLAEQLTP
jgi:hypothetical protein